MASFFLAKKSTLYMNRYGSITENILEVINNGRTE